MCGNVRLVEAVADPPPGGFDEDVGFDIEITFQGCH
jgi:hypothetical protein